MLRPLVALPLWAFNLYVRHQPALYEAALENDFRRWLRAASR